ncbi:MAG: nucleotidyltransferase [Myxococcota bacterium]|nr:nucleotidyltransferase [Myxococcota bacterium]
MATDIPTLLAEAWAALGEAGAPCAVIGGCARNAYAEVRATKDVDLVVDADPESYPRVVAALARRGFRRGSAVGGEPGAVPDLELFRDEAGRRVDILFAHTDFERSALARRERREPYAGVEVWVVSPEDLIVYKVLAGRPQDRLDVLAMLGAFEQTERRIDWAYVERWCDAWDARDALDRVRAELSSG